MPAQRVEIIAIGSELLTPYYQDTNSLYLSQKLNDLGIEVSYKSIVGDEKENLICCINTAKKRSDIVISIGGLGPTDDDRTREAFAEALGKELIFKENILQKITGRFNRRGYSMPSVNKKQAYIIEGSEVLENNNGTAPGLWLETGSKIYILLPGPPHELIAMFEPSVISRLNKFGSGSLIRKTLKITGLTESKVESLISDLYPSDPLLSITTLASPGQIEIHITSRSFRNVSEAKKKLLCLQSSLQSRLAKNVFSESGKELEEVIGELLVRAKKTIAVAESCTGGFLGHRITNVSGSSLYFIQGVQVYSNDAKTRLLGIPSEIIMEHGAVSSEVAKQMASNIREKSNTDYGIGITGIAGPTGGTKEKPVGLVYISLAWKENSIVTRNQFLGTRRKVKYQASQKALDILRRHMLL